MSWGRQEVERRLEQEGEKAFEDLQGLQQMIESLEGKVDEQTDEAGVEDRKGESVESVDLEIEEDGREVLFAVRVKEKRGGGRSKKERTGRGMLRDLKERAESEGATEDNTMDWECEKWTGSSLDRHLKDLWERWRRCLCGLRGLRRPCR